MYLCLKLNIMDKGQILTTVIDLVRNTPNDMDLGKAVRALINNNQEDKPKDSK